MRLDGVEVNLEVVPIFSDGEDGAGRDGEGGGHIRNPYSCRVRIFGTNNEHVKSKIEKCSIFTGFLSHVRLVVSRFGVASVSLGIDADAGAVVGRADEFDAGGFEGCFDGIEVGFCTAWDASRCLHAHNCAAAYGGCRSQLLDAPV